MLVTYPVRKRRFWTHVQAAAARAWLGVQSDRGARGVAVTTLMFLIAFVIALLLSAVHLQAAAALTASIGALVWMCVSMWFVLLPLRDVLNPEGVSEALTATCLVAAVLGWALWAAAEQALDAKKSPSGTSLFAYHAIQTWVPPLTLLIIGFLGARIYASRTAAPDEPPTNPGARATAEREELSSE